MSKIKDYSVRQAQWAKAYRNKLVERGVSGGDAESDSNRQLLLMREQAIDPDGEEWHSPEEAAIDYQQFISIPRADIEKQNSWDMVELLGLYTIIAAFLRPVIDLINGKLRWSVPLTPRFFLAIPFVAVLFAIIICGNLLFQKYGFLKTALLLFPLIVLDVAILFLPDSIWGDALKIAYGKIPTILLIAILVALGAAVKRFGKIQSKRFKNAFLLKTWEQHKTGDIRGMNEAWFAQLEFILRNGYHYSNKMIAQFLPDLRMHLAEISGGKNLITAEEEFGRAPDFAFELAKNNRAAIIKTRIINLLQNIFGLAISIVCLATGFGSLFAEGNSLGSWLIVVFGIPMFILFAFTSYLGVKELIAVRQNRGKNERV